MVGGGHKKDDGLPAISSTNIFAALESRRRKTSSKKKLEREQSKGKDAKTDTKEEEPEKFWSATQVSVKSWADCDDEEDYYATTAPPPEEQPFDAASTAQKESLSQGEETECDEEIEGEEVDDEAEEEEGELENGTTTETDDVQGPEVVLPPVFREPERQLSKKELKKKGLADLDAVLAELGLNTKEEKEENGVTSFSEDTKTVDAGDGDNDEISTGGAPSLTNSKSSKRRKAKKEKSFKERDGDVLPTPDSDSVRKEEDTVAEEVGEIADPKEVLKRMTSLKKKKSTKEGDGASKAAAAEAAARAARLAAAKKKEKNHYNQQPVR